MLEEVRAKDRNLILSRHFTGIIAYLLVKDGRQNYKVITSHSLIDIYVGNNEEYTSLNELRMPMLIITVSKQEMENKRRDELLYQMALERVGMNKGLTIITDRYPDTNPYLALGFHIISAGASTGTSVEAQEDLF